MIDQTSNRTEVAENTRKPSRGAKFYNTYNLTLVKTDSAQRSSNKCKKYLPKNYSYHGNILNAI